MRQLFIRRFLTTTAERSTQPSALSNLRFGVRLQFVSEVGVIGLFPDITQLSTPLPRNASCSPRVSLRTSPSVPVGEGRVRGYVKTRGPAD